MNSISVSLAPGAHAYYHLPSLSVCACVCNRACVFRDTAWMSHAYGIETVRGRDRIRETERGRQRTVKLPLPARALVQSCSSQPVTFFFAKRRKRTENEETKIFFLTRDHSPHFPAGLPSSNGKWQCVPRGREKRDPSQGARTGKQTWF